MKELFREQAKSILVYPGIEIDLDPIEHNVEVSYLNPLPIQGIVNDLTFAQVQYKMPGIVTDKTKEIVVEKKYRTLLELSQKIQIAGETDYYEGWRVNGKMQIREEGDYIRVYIYIKKDAD